MKDINWNDMPEWADSYCEIDQYNIFWMNDEQYQYTHGDPEIYKFAGDSAHNLQDTVGKRTYPPKQSEEVVDETQSIRTILEEAFNKVYEQHGVRLERVGFEYTRSTTGVKVLDVDVEGGV